MPRFTLNLNAPYKKFNNYKPLPKYKILIPPVLRDSVSNRGDRNKVSPCLQEMSVMFACWKKNDFIESRCVKELEQFTQCMIAVKTLALRQAAGENVSTGRPSATVVNKMLKRFPQPVPTLKVKF